MPKNPETLNPFYRLSSALTLASSFLALYRQHQPNLNAVVPQVTATKIGSRDIT